MKNVFRSLSIVAYAQASLAKGIALQALARNPGVLLLLFGIMLTAMPFGAAHAAGLSSLLSSWGDTVRDVIDFIMTIGVLVGVGAIFYGCKLIIDKSNDRENVKNSHIVVSFVGGAMLCILWFVVTMLAETAGEGSVGEGASF